MKITKVCTIPSFNLTLLHTRGGISNITTASQVCNIVTIWSRYVKSVKLLYAARVEEVAKNFQDQIPPLA
jgi:hypothetical protein